MLPLCVRAQRLPTPAHLSLLAGIATNCNQAFGAYRHIHSKHASTPQLGLQDLHFLCACVSGGFQPPHLLPIVVHLLLQPCVLLTQLLGYGQFTLCCPAQPASPLCYPNSRFTACSDIYRWAGCPKHSSSGSVCAALHTLHHHTLHRCSSKHAHGSWEQGNCSSSTVSSVCFTLSRCMV